MGKLSIVCGQARNEERLGLIHMVPGKVVLPSVSEEIAKQKICRAKDV